MAHTCVVTATYEQSQEHHEFKANQRVLITKNKQRPTTNKKTKQKKTTHLQKNKKQKTKPLRNSEQVVESIHFSKPKGVFDIMEFSEEKQDFTR